MKQPWDAKYPVLKGEGLYDMMYTGTTVLQGG